MMEQDQTEVVVKIPDNPEPESESEPVIINNVITPPENDKADPLLELIDRIQANANRISELETRITQWTMEQREKAEEQKQESEPEPEMELETTPESESIVVEEISIPESKEKQEIPQNRNQRKRTKLLGKIFR